MSASVGGEGREPVPSAKASRCGFHTIWGDFQPPVLSGSGERGRITSILHVFISKGFLLNPRCRVVGLGWRLQMMGKCTCFSKVSAEIISVNSGYWHKFRPIG